MTEERYWTLLARKLAGELTEEEAAEWAQLRRRYPHLAYSAESMEQLWAGTTPPPGADAKAALERHLQRMADAGIALPEGPVTAPRKRRRAWLALPAAACLLLASWLLLRGPADAPRSTPPVARHSEVSTRPGSRTRVLLPDSTVVLLNAGSRLTYTEGFGVSHRRTELTGEAFFDVTHNADLPFIIQTRDVRIRVLGTAFNVKAYPGEATETSLLRGQVQLTLEKRPGETYRLRPNEKLVVGAAADTAAGHPLVELRSLERTPGREVIETAWIDNKLVFRNEPLAQLAARMTRWYNVPVEVKDAALGEERVSGSFANESLSQALEELQLIAHFRLLQQDGRYILVSP